jgi:outer membrane protein OmpA-like peptidoglycan-associated protein
MMVHFKFIQPLGWSLPLSCLLCWHGNVQAADSIQWPDRPWYLGVSVGDSHLQPETIPLRNALTLQGASLSDVRFHSHEPGYKVYLGTMLGPYLAMEAGYFRLGEVDFSARTQLPDTTTAELIAGRLKSQGPELALIAMLPLGQQLSLSARLGLAYHNTKAPLFYPAALNLDGFAVSKDFLEYSFGGGFHYQWSPTWSTRLELEHYRLDNLWGRQGDVKLLTIGLAYHFGYQQSDYQVSAAPEPRAQPSESAQPAAPLPVNVVPIVQLELADIHFNFDQSSLTESAKTLLQQHVAVLQSQPDRPLQIAGYTSASGTEQYNQQLSERRANAVKQYLQSAGILGERMTTIGYGEQSPASLEVNPTDLRSVAAKANMRVLFQLLMR